MPISSWAGTYYVSHGAYGTWGTGNGQCGEPNGAGRSHPCSFLAAVDNAAPGDTVIFIADGGIYNDDAAGIIGGLGASRSQSGTPGNVITYEGEAGTTVVLSNNRQQLVNLDGLSYIKIKNFTITSPQSYAIALINGAHHITIENCIMNAIGRGDATWAFIYGTGANNNINIKNNIINGGSAGNPTHADLIYFVNTGYTQEYILIEGNTINEGGSHSAIDIQAGSKTTRNIVIRNNTIDNKNHTTFNVYGYPSKVLIENNIIKNAGSICSLTSCQENTLGSAGDRSQRRDQKNGIQFMATDAIVRHNYIYKNGSGIELGPSSSTTQRNRFYNNTFYKNCVGIRIPNWGYDVTDNVFLNNILKDNTEASSQTNYPIYFSLQSSTKYAVKFGYNYADESNNSYYRDPTQIKTGTLTQLNTDTGGTIFYNNMLGSVLMVDPANYNFRLQSGSPTINAGGPLTTVHATDTGTGISLKVTDAKFFQDGSWGPAGEVSADWIAVGNPNNVVQISSINYSTNTMTLMNSIPRNVGDRVWLYKDSDGTIVFYSLAPDIGAYESLPPPTNLR